MVQNSSSHAIPVPRTTRGARLPSLLHLFLVFVVALLAGAVLSDTCTDAAAVGHDGSSSVCDTLRRGAPAGKEHSLLQALPREHLLLQFDSAEALASQAHSLERSTATTASSLFEKAVEITKVDGRQFDETPVESDVKHDTSKVPPLSKVASTSVQSTKTAMIVHDRDSEADSFSNIDAAKGSKSSSSESHSQQEPVGDGMLAPVLMQMHRLRISGDASFYFVCGVLIFFLVPVILFVTCIGTNELQQPQQPQQVRTEQIQQGKMQTHVQKGNQQFPEQSRTLLQHLGTQRMPGVQPLGAPTVKDIGSTDGIGKDGGQAEAYPFLSGYPCESTATCRPASIARLDLGARRRSPAPAQKTCQDVRGITSSLSAFPSARAYPEARTPRGQQLCPSLVVPRGMEFTFAVRELISRDRQDTSFSVVDLNNNPLCFVMVQELNNTSRRSGIYLELLRRDCGGNAQEGGVFSKEPLAHVRTEMLHDGSGGVPEICRPDGKVFCKVTPEARPSATGGGILKRYVLKDNSGVQLAAFHGHFREKAVNGIAQSGALMCATKRCTIDADNGADAQYYEVRVAEHADAGLLLCGLLAIDKIEGGLCVD